MNEKVVVKLKWKDEAGTAHTFYKVFQSEKELQEAMNESGLFHDNYEIIVPYKYQGFRESVNDQPVSYVSLWVSDWNQDHWGFYVYIDMEDYETCIDRVQALIALLNWRGVDVYMELVDHSGDLPRFYNYLYELGKYSHDSVLNPEYWEILKEKGDKHFGYFSEIIGSNNTDELRNTEFIVFSDEYEIIENYYPVLAGMLEEYGLWGYFDVDRYIEQNTEFHRIDGDFVEAVY